MAVPVRQDWPYKPFRARFVAEIEESIRLAGMTGGRPAAEIEEIILGRTFTRDDYLALVTQFINCIKEYNKNQTPQEMDTGVNMGQQGHINAGAPPGTGDNQGSIQDLLNALQNLTLQGGTAGPSPRR